MDLKFIILKLTNQTFHGSGLYWELRKEYTSESCEQLRRSLFTGEDIRVEVLNEIKRISM